MFLTDDAATRFMAFGVAANQLLAIQCPACGVGGHYPWDCGTVHGLNNLARTHRVPWEWGAMKGAMYYQDWEAGHQAEVLRHREVQAAKRAKAKK